VYSDFYEIPLPALRFEKVEETDTKVKTTTKRTTPSKSTTSKSKRNRRSNKEKQIHSQEMTRKENSKTLPEQRPTMLTGSEQRHLL
jgi:hypothetical protein